MKDLSTERGADEILLFAIDEEIAHAADKLVAHDCLDVGHAVRHRPEIQWQIRVRG